ncbi:uncharacterized protein LOC135348654 [Halichondria panicea]|uniref:uncharacterized protein LOC135348654 n=1 Tax=Halichondria panicea TaxID=6063 RepID=UPI00312B31CE
MANSGRRISSLNVTYEEQYMGNSWAARQAGDEACTPLGYEDTAAVPADISVGGELCGPLPGDELCANTQPYNTLGYNDNEVKEPDNCLPELLPPLGYPKPPQSVVDSGFEGCSGNNVLYVLEDRLRHKVNVSIEDFRADLQHVFYEEFGLYRQSMMAREEARSDQPMCEDVERSCDSVCTNQSSVDSGVSGGHGVEQEEGTVINECLIKLQMCAATITSSLQRAEYTVTN